jgi:uncharacterized protein involved in response to NO
MIFGYALAVIAGFLFTAVRNWTGRPTPSGGWLIAVCTLWLAGRVLVLSPFGLAAALVSAAFPIAVGIGIAVPLVQSGNKRNYFFVGLLVLMGAADLVFNLSAWRTRPARTSRIAGGAGRHPVRDAVMGGRLIDVHQQRRQRQCPAARDRRSLRSGTLVC